MEEEDTHLFNSLGVTSANPDDIERDILAEVRNDSGNNNEAGVNKEVLDKSKCHEQPSPSRRKELYKKLRAVKFEIDAVASTIEHARDDKKFEDCVPESDDDRGCLADVKVTRQGSVIDTTLQQALATERLRSLEKTEAQLKNELRHCTNGYSQGVEDYEILRSLVNEEPRKKRKLKEVQKLIKGQGKKQKEVSYDDDAEFDSMLDAASTGFVETERDTLVRKGFLTPFHKLKGFERRLQQPGPYNKKNELEGEDKNEDPASASVDRALQSISEAAQARPTTKLLDSNDLPKLDPPTRPFHRLKKPIKVSHGDSKADTRKDVTTLNSFLTEKRKDGTGKIKRPLPGKKWRKIISREENIANGNEEAVESLVTSSYEDENQNVLSEDNIELPFVTVEGGLRIPENIFSELFDYQKVGVQWLWELHCQRAGGIIGDEMGLGKTVQVLSFLGALHFSKMYKPSIIICPVTLLRQWKREAKKWYPDFHVEILHDSAQDLTNKKKQSKDDGSDYESGSSIDTDSDGNLSCRNTNKWDSLINRVLRSESGLLVTTYEQLRLLGEQLLDVEWGYAVLDEGHRIRNPNAETTLVCKQLQTVHRIIMTGAPIQNKLAELWSLFDFVFPGKLGVLPVFEAEFAVPISVGGYANATPLQVSTAYRCAVVLRDLIMPYLLRRMKADVRAHLPKKIEHVLFCSLTAEQRSTYRAFLASSEVEQIFDGSRNSLSGIDVMRKICNHPDLLERDHAHGNPDYGNPERSGKMKVVAQVLKVWKEQGHRVLLFSQTQQMLDILESFLISGRYNYRRLDGLTPIRQRMALIDEFNNSDDVFIFILTTKVGGLGTNLTGADRVIIFDPDWNPSTDMQARERAWRIGQKRDVTVYRLITRGTIEEKVYHRQIYKHFLTNKILNNPRQKRFFKARDMKDLFSLTDDGDGLTETSNIFSQITGDVHVGATGGSLAQINQNFEATAAPYAEGPTVEKGNNLERESSENIGKGKNDQNDGEVDEETSILKSLFDAHGLHSALNHDAIMNAHDGEKTRLEEQASQVAARAAEALRQSRMLRGRASVSVPTWTGKSGSAGAPSLASQKFGSTVGSQFATSSVHFEEPSRRLPNGFPAGTSAGKALSSADLLARIRGNQEQAVSDGLLQHELGMSFASRNGERSPNPRSAPHSLSGVQPEVLIRQICTFIQQRGGVASSAGIVAHFKDRIPSKDLPLFKRLLKEIATLEKGTSGSSWVLKPEYRQQ